MEVAALRRDRQLVNRLDPGWRNQFRSTGAAAWGPGSRGRVDTGGKMLVIDLYLTPPRAENDIA